jgi:hypothetical protein
VKISVLQLNKHCTPAIEQRRKRLDRTISARMTSALVRPTPDGIAMLLRRPKAPIARTPPRSQTPITLQVQQVDPPIIVPVGGELYATSLPVVQVHFYW